VLADTRPSWRPTLYASFAFGCATTCSKPAGSLTDFADDESAMRINSNPFAFVTAAHLRTQQTRRQPERCAEAKWRLAQALYTRNWDVQRVFDLYLIIDSLMRLPANLEHEVWDKIHELCGSTTMRYISSAERFGREEGLEQGLAKGRREALREVLARQLTKRFGPLASEVQARLQAADAGQLEAWVEAVLDADSVEEVFAR